MEKKNVEIDLLIETSWEVCNKVGGIYTVLSTKAASLKRLYKDKLIFIGPDVWSDDNPSPFFEPSETVLKKWRNALSLPNGITVRVGRWDIPGRPIAILVKFDSMYAVKNELYAMMWERYHVDSLHAYGDYDEACAFSHASALVIESLVNFYCPDQKRVIAHFNEWTTGMGLLHVKATMPGVSTIFTTHATSIGRSICGNGKPLYDYMSGYNGDQMAGELNMESKHSLEKAAAHQADCFTTVSDITAIECAQLLDKRPDIVTPNGFEKDFVPGPRSFKKQRSEARKSLLDVATTLTGAKYNDDTFVLITSGRCEYRNKGLDMFLDSMARLGDLDPTRRVLAYVMVPAWVKEARADLKNSLATANRSTRLAEPIITHTLNNPNEDPVLNRVRQIGFTNDANSRVSVIYVPCYLNGTDGIFDMTYYQLLIGADATVFASYYEPWGYTPLESVAFGVPTVTTCLSGFGRWVLSAFDNNPMSSGVKVVDRTDSNYADATEQIALTIKHLVNAPAGDTETYHRSAMATAQAAAWENFISYYLDAFEIAMANNQKRR